MQTPSECIKKKLASLCVETLAVGFGGNACVATSAMSKTKVDGYIFGHLHIQDS